MYLSDYDLPPPSPEWLEAIEDARSRLVGKVGKKYKLTFRQGFWLLWDQHDGYLLDKFDSLAAAHDWATACAITDECFEPGGLERFKAMKTMAGMAWLESQGYRW